MAKMTWNELRDNAYRTAKTHGFHTGSESVQHYLTLVVSELSEAVEADRRRKHALLDRFNFEKDTPQAPDHVIEHWRFVFEQFVKDTVEDELADATIRLLDLSGLLDIDLDLKVDEYIGKYYDEMEISSRWNGMSLTEHIWDVLTVLVYKDPQDAICEAIGYLFCLAIDLGMNLQEHIQLKMTYNEMRSYKHGKSY